jgi:SAM-dependent methyltransferase
VQGAIIWPASSPVLTSLVEEDRLPLADNSVDLMLAIHCLELSDSVRRLLREIWRVLKPEGRLLAVVPNRRGVWARLERTPFGHGRPYSASQLERLLREALFEPVEIGSALHIPPFKRPRFLGVARTIGRMSARLGPAFAGVIIVEVRKEVVAPSGGAVTRAETELATARN